MVDVNDITENPGVALFVAILVVAVVVIAGGLLLNSGGSNDSGGNGAGSAEGPNVIMSLRDHPAPYNPGPEGGRLPTQVVNVVHRTGDTMKINKLDLVIVNKSSGEEVVRWSRGELQSGTAQDVFVRLKRGKSAGEAQETIATSTAVSDKTLTPGDTLVVIDDASTIDFSTLSTYRVRVIHRPSGEAVLSQDIAIQ